MKSFFAIFKKELKRIFTDRRLVVTLFLPGVLIYAMYTLMGAAMFSDTDDSEKYAVCIENLPTELSELVESTDAMEFDVRNADGQTPDDIQKSVTDGALDLYVIFPENFWADMSAYDSASGNPAPKVQIYYNSASSRSSVMYSYFVSSLDAIESQIANRFDVALEDKASADDIAVSVISQLMPMLLMLFLFSGAMAVCTEAIAGEKERGTIANLLLTPTRREVIVTGKLAALGITSVISATCSFVGLILSLPKLMGDEISLSVYGAGTYVMILLVLFVTVMLFTVILTLVSTFAKSAKEAQGYSVPVMLVVMLIGIAGMFDLLGDTTTLHYLIPVFNSMLSVKGILALDYSVAGLAVTVVSNLAYVVLAIFALTRMFKSEKIMFNA